MVVVGVVVEVRVRGVREVASGIALGVGGVAQSAGSLLKKPLRAERRGISLIWPLAIRLASGTGPSSDSVL